MIILGLSTSYKYHQDLLQLWHAQDLITEFATSHKPEVEMHNREYYKKHGTKLIDGKDFYRVDKMSKLVAPDAPALDKQMLEYFTACERDFYILTDRYSFFPVPFRVRKRLFRQGLRFWLDFFAKNKVDAVFSVCTPHNLPDYTAFHVAKYLNIPVLLTADVMINDYILVVSDYRQTFKTPADYLAGKSDDEIKATIAPKLLQKAFAESSFINFSKRMNDKTLGLKNVNATTDDDIKQRERAKKFAKRKKRLKKLFSLSAYKPRFKTNFAMNRQYSDFRRRFFRIRRGFELKQLKKQYDALAVAPDFSKKYVYFAMHLTPERTTQPESETFEDHLLAVEILSAAVPADWVIYVKENPTQYTRIHNLVNGKGFRDKSDYDDLLRRPNVRLIRQDVKTIDLIKHAAVVSTLKGSVGWESINSGKPVLIFANAWYHASRSAYRVSNVAECKAAIAEITAKTPAQVFTDKLKFLSYMQDNITIGNIGNHANLEVATEPYDNLVNNLAENIAQRFLAKA